MTTTDKHGQPIEKGDTVEFVYGGDRHEVSVEKLTEEHGVPHVHASLATHVPAASVRVVAKAEKPKKAEHKAEAKNDEPKDETPKAPVGDGPRSRPAHAEPTEDSKKDAPKTTPKGK